jgi:ATP-dependent exoDNAse (exonuclease V) beta subunit
VSNQLDGVTTYLAGAGTGKTYQICEEIKDAILDGMDPDRVIATTFTNKAAAELKDRVKQHIYDEDHLSTAEKIEHARGLEQAAIGTVHGLGTQFLKKYAIPLGLSPQLNVLDEEGSERTLNSFLNTIDRDRWERLNEHARPLAVDSVRGVLESLIDEKRQNDIAHDAFRDAMQDSVDRLCDLLAPDGVDDTHEPLQQFTVIAEQVREDLKACGHNYKYVTNAIRDLNNDVIYAGEITWKTLAKFADFDPGTKVEDIVQPVRDFAGTLRTRPELHDDLRAFMDVLTEEVIRIENEYQQYKEERGLLDYTDLEVEFLDALNDDEIAADVASAFDVLLVDEFQDSNPIQLAIFLRLHELIDNSFWVGDEKQSIYGFRDADLELVRDAVELVDPEQRASLDTSYRAHRSLVSLFNDLFVPVFGDDARLEADDDSTPDGAVERWCLDASNNSEEQRTTAEGIRRLIDETYDPGEVAVLTRSNARAQAVGEALDDLGVPNVVEKPGLLNTRECALALAGMKVVADPQDTLARAEIHHLMAPSNTEVPDWIEDRLEEMHERRAQDDGNTDEIWANDPYAEPLLDVESDLMSPSSIAEDVIQKLDLPEHIARWGTPDRRAANLNAFVDLVGEYEHERTREGRGVTTRGFIEWAADLRDEDEDPIPVQESAEAVTLMTYHSAKGLQWPVVVMTELHKTPRTDLWQPRVTGGRVADGKPLKDRHLSYWQWPFGEHAGKWGGKISGTGLKDDAEQTDEAEHIMQKERGEHRRVLYVGMTRASERLVLTHRGTPDDLPEPDHYEGLAPFPIDEVLRADETGEGTIELPDHETTLRIRHIAPDEVDPEQQTPDTVTDLHIDPPEDTEYAPRYDLDVEEDIDEENVTYRTEQLPGQPPMEAADTPINPNDWTALGSAVHAYYAGLPTLQHLDPDEKQQIAEQCLENHGVRDALPPALLVTSAERFREWVTDTFNPTDRATEVPATAPINDSQAVGIMDVLIEPTPDEFVIVDHKIKPVPEEMWQQTAAEHVHQLYAYQKLLEQQDKHVTQTWIHLPLAGGVIQMEYSSSA